MLSSLLHAYLIYDYRKDSWQLSSNPAVPLMSLIYPECVSNSTLHTGISFACNKGLEKCNFSGNACEDNKERKHSSNA